MYIRRKVFSVALDENGEERYFSTNEIINEEDYLDEVMYSEEEEPKKKSHLGRNIALGTAGTAALAGGGIYGAHKYGDSQIAKAGKINEILEKNALGGKLTKKELKVIDKYANEKGGKKVEAMLKRAEKAQKPGKWITEKARKGGSWTVDTAKRGDAWVKAHPYKASGAAAAAVGLTAAGIYGAKKLKERKANKGSED